MPFDGFPRNVRATAVPDPLFNSLLEDIEDVAELKVTLRLVWLLGQQRGQPKFVAESDILNDPALARGLEHLGGDPGERVRQGLNLAVTRGTLLRHASADQGEVRCYLLNTDDNRRRLAQGDARIRSAAREKEPTPAGPPAAARGQPANSPNIYDLYENNIGTIGPLMAEQLAEAEERYPPQWIEEAFKLATYENKRSWRYIAGILRRWAAEGRAGFEEPANDSRNTQPGVGVKAGATLWDADGMQHGEHGRHSEEDDRSGQPRSRQRR